MKTKSKRMLSTLLALAFALSLSAAIPVAVNAVSAYTVDDAAGLSDVLGELKDGDNVVIKLTADIEYYATIEIYGKIITFDLDGHKLDVSVASGYALDVREGGMAVLSDPGNGELNFFTSASNDAAVYVSGAGSYAMIANTVFTGDSAHGAICAHNGGEIVAYGDVTNSGGNSTGGYGAFANGGKITVKGSITCTGSGPSGAIAQAGGRITVDGTITVENTSKYVSLGYNDNRTQEGHSAASTKNGYYEYADEDNIIWVKAYPFMITTAPQSQSVLVDSNVTFTVAAVGAAPLNFQWLVNSGSGWVPLSNSSAVSGASDTALKLSRVALAMDGNLYRCEVTDSAGPTVMSEIALLNVVTEKAVTVGAQSGTLKHGEAGTVTFPVTTAGIENGKTGTVSWFKDEAGTEPGTAPAGITTTVTAVAPSKASVTMTATAATVGGTYYFKVTIDGTVSGVAALTIAEAATPGMHNFVRIRTYTSGQFKDVDENAWYGFNNQKSIATAYEYGLVQGLDSTTFNPNGKITVSGLIVLAVNVRRIYNAETGSLVMGDPWYKVYIDYAIANDMIGANDFNASDYEREATRAEMAYIFSRCLPAKEYTKQNTVNSLPDVDSSTKYSDAIFAMYESGIVRGNDSAGTFYPDRTVPRYETAAIICLVILPDTRTIGNIYG